MMSALLVGCSGLGTEKDFNGVQLFYTSGVRESLVDSLGQFLIASEFADGQSKTIQLNLNEQTYEFRMVVKKGIETDPEYIEFAKQYAAQMSASLFGGVQVDIHFCDDNMNTLRVIPMDVIDQTQQATEVETGSVSSGEFSMSYPATWTADESGQGGTLYIFYSPAEDANDQFKENVNVVTEELSDASVDLATYTEASVQQLKKVMNAINFLENNESASGGYQQLVYTAQQGALNLQFVQRYYIKNNKAYIVTFTCEQSKWDTYKESGVSILDSFKFE